MFLIFVITVLQFAFYVCEQFVRGLVDFGKVQSRLYARKLKQARHLVRVKS